ncbi:hypothetical protein BH23GEM3_BH23GEM3_13440 [soil metagenome]|nr:hypothetical protein [Gemmatimonadota bacterium]
MSEEITRIELPHPLQVEVYRRMSSAERLAAGFRSTEFVRGMLRARFTGLHPAWSAEQVEATVARRMLGKPE